MPVAQCPISSERGRDAGNLARAITFLSDPERAHEYAVQMRWQHGACPHGPRLGLSAGDRDPEDLRCKELQAPSVGTALRTRPSRSSRDPDLRAPAELRRNGTSSCELSRALGVSQETASFMLHCIGETIKTRTFETKLQRQVEIDATYIRGKMRNKPARVRRQLRGDSLEDKTAVVRVVERGGRVHALALPPRTKARLGRSIPKCNVRSTTTRR